MKRSTAMGAAVVAILCSISACQPPPGVTGAAAHNDGGAVKIGWISSLTGPLSAAAAAENRGVRFAVQQINEQGGIDGRKVELTTRDTQGDPTKAVNAAKELTLREGVDFIIGPVNSGESVPVTPVLARSHTPNMVIATVDSLTDPEKYPLAFRVIPTNEQWVTAANDYAMKDLGLNRVAILADSTGYGTTTADQAKKLFTASGGTVTYTGLIDIDQTDVTSDVAKARASGAQAILVWSASSGLNARIINARAAIGWKAPILGHPALAAGDTGKLLTNRSNWGGVYAVGYRSMSRDEEQRLPASTSKFVADAGRSVLGEDINYTLWWVAMGYDAVQVIRHAVEKAGGTDRDAVQDALTQTRDLPGVFATYSWSVNDRNGISQNQVVMNEADSFDRGTFRLAPGY
ncbi:ABC transporter substrate-binding protein [Mycobacterium sp. NPDC003449]